MQRIIVTYEEIPDRSRVYELFLDEETVARFKKINKKFVNLGDNEEGVDDEILALYDTFLKSTEPVIDSSSDDIGVMDLTGKQYDALIWTGFFL